MGIPHLLCSAFWILGHFGWVFTHILFSAGHSLCGDPDSSVETAPEEAEAQDLESSDEADKMSKVRKLPFSHDKERKHSTVTADVLTSQLHTTRASFLGKMLILLPKVFMDDLNVTNYSLDFGTSLPLGKTCALFPGLVHIFSILW